MTPQLRQAAQAVMAVVQGHHAEDAQRIPECVWSHKNGQITLRPIRIRDGSVLTVMNDIGEAIEGHGYEVVDLHLTRDGDNCFAGHIVLGPRAQE